ncbi:MAG: hypothetical protein PHF25_00735 [Candidatus Margulisbacteria bacterium]|nr:hypothetical protein [Candidatus Margulisiibacteriota bacterium]
MKKLLIAVIILMSTIIYAEEVKMPKVFELDGFEDGIISEEPAWWTFGDINAIPVSTQIYKGDPMQAYLGKYSLSLKGSTKDWYVGGLGTYVGIDASRYTHLKMFIYGNGPKSGKLTIQLYDDDNKNFILEQDVEKDYEPIFDDKIEFSQTVSWKGWKVILVPLANFKDVNPTVGDNKLNLDQKDGSGGLLHFQIIVLADDKEGTVDMAIDDIKLIDMVGE